MCGNLEQTKYVISAFGLNLCSVIQYIKSEVNTVNMRQKGIL